MAATALAATHSGHLWADAGSTAIPDRLAALSGSGQALQLSAAEIKDLRASLHGSVLRAQ
ncbi:MAG TPA: hypothetical protein VIY90_06605 [Steroidobacteraceae bacterium]